MKTLNIFIATLLLSLFVIQSSAQTFTFNSSTGVITGLDPANPSPTTVTIPDEISAVKVRGIGNDAFDGKSSITSLTFNTTQLDSIGMGSFRGCTGLTSITIPTSVTRIGFWAFQNCNQVATVSFSTPSSLTYIGQGAFEAMNKLTDIVIPNTVNTIMGFAFYNSKGLVSITLPNSITSIGDNLFINCTSLSSITIPNSVTSIGVNTFLNDSALTTIVIPNNVTIIKDGAFDNCKKLSSLTFEVGSKLNSIGINAFRYNAINSISFPASLKTIGNFAFKANSQLTNIDLNSVETIGDVAFQWCNSLSSITIPNTVNAIGGYAFDGCANLGTLAFASGSTVSTIKNNAFAGTKLTTISIPNSVSNIGEWAFSNCSFLSDVTFTKGSSLLNIDKFTFRNNPALRNVTLSNSLLHLRQGAFENSGLLTITIPASVDSIGNYAFINCANLTTVKILRETNPLTLLGFVPFLNTSASLSILVPAVVLNEYKTKWTDYTAKIIANPNTGLKNSFSNELVVFQNTASNYLTIKGVSGANLQIVDILGHPIYQIAHLSDNEQIDINYLKSGCYIVIIENENNRYSSKIIK